MKISTNWLNDYVNIKDLDKKELAEQITHAGVNVEGITGNICLDNFLVGYVKSVKKHENSDHLNVCIVDFNTFENQIVCGAPNVKEGIKVVVSLPGAILPNGLEIKKSTIRGVESNGMICSLEELGLEEKSEGIHILSEDAVIGESPRDYLNLDIVYNLDLNPNRKNDCLNHLGFAYEVGAVTGLDITLPEVTYTESDFKTDIDLKVETDACILYLAKLVKNITIKESPDFIKQRIISAGMRPINNVVDISNYIMLELGQPLHFFDADKVGKNILVRQAKENEKITTLDEKERTLNENDIVITDGEKPICIAGVMGGLNTEVDASTKNIIIESAIFDKLKVRYTSIKLDLRSEASLRYEVGINYEYTYLALKRACHLLEKYAGATISKDEKIINKITPTENKVTVTLEEINKVLGVKVTDEIVKSILKRLKFSFEEINQTYTVTIPNRRLDISIKEDIIEEVGRLYGFDKIEAKMPKLDMVKGGYTPRIKYRKDISTYMRASGFNEIRTYQLINEENLYNFENQEPVNILKPISNDKTVLRVNLISSLIDTLNYNLARGEKDIFIYEISNIYTKENDEYKEEMKLGALALGRIIKNTWKKSEEVDFYFIKGTVMSLLEYLGYSNRIRIEKNEKLPFLHKGVSADILVDNKKVGYIGRLHPNIVPENAYIFEISLDKLKENTPAKIKFTAPSKYPSIKMDMSFEFDKNIISKNVITDIYKFADKTLKDVHIFDVYDKDDKRSLGFNLTFESNEKTLEDIEVKKVFENIIRKVEEKYNAKLRNK